MALALLFVSLGAGAQELNGFDLSGALIDVAEVKRGGPPRDGIPALDAPEMGPADRAAWPASSMVIGVVGKRADGRTEARAYPLDVLVWHELVNDTIGGQPILVSYCPLCGSAMVFARPGDTRFGVSGLLYRSDLLMFDRETDSLWTQIEGRAISGPRAGERLELMRSSFERWDAWRARYPDTLVLSPRTGHRRNYVRNPFGNYARSRKLMFDGPTDAREHPKARTIGLRTTDGDVARAYPVRLFEDDDSAIVDTFAGHEVRVAFSKERNAFVVEAPETIDVVETYWFAWMAFHPESSVYTRPSD